MRLSKVVLPLMCMCTLTSCGISASKEEFVKKGNEVAGKYNYDKVSVDYSAKTDTEKGAGSCSFTYKNGKYVADEPSEITGAVSLYFSFTPNSIDVEKSFKYYEDAWLDYYKDDGKVEWSVKYFVSPFKVVGKFKSTATTKETVKEKKMDFTYKFDEYFNITSYVGEITTSENTEKDGYKVVSETNSYTKIKFKYSNL